MIEFIDSIPFPDLNVTQSVTAFLICYIGSAVIGGALLLAPVGRWMK